MSKINLTSSFRDPSGFLFRADGMLYRQVNRVYKANYDLLRSSGLYDKLVTESLLVPHEEVALSAPMDLPVYKIIKPELIKFISYPYEWCFSQLKDAALLTLKIQKIALSLGLSLKDASAYNIQFKNDKPIFIDTLSFEKYIEGSPWVAYKQFCQHFLAPLALMSFRDVRLNQLFRIFIDGIPLEMASSLLPFKTKFNLSLFMHIHVHAQSQLKYSDKVVVKNNSKISKFALLGLIDSLESAVNSLNWLPGGTEWGEYYENNNNYNENSFQRKKELVELFLAKTNSKTVWDIGANMGLFSRIASAKGCATVSFDIDYSAVEKNYLQIRKSKETNLLPLFLDLTNPSPNLGWANAERDSLEERGPADTVFALALIHHLAISNNLPFAMIADYFSKICKHLIIEFVPKSDSQVKKLLSTREDVFPGYTQEDFEKEFSKFFNLLDSEKIESSERTLYFFGKK